MGERATKLKQSLFTVFPVICLLGFTVSIGCVIISLSPDVTWNEFIAGDLYGTGLTATYTSNLWSSMDPSHFDSRTGRSKYMEVLAPIRDETWKQPIRFGLTKAIGLISGSLFLLLTVLIIPAVTQQKLFMVIAELLSCALGITGGYFCIQAMSDYKTGLVSMISIIATGPGEFYDSDKEKMKLGYLLAQYGAIAAFVTCFLVLVKCGLYILFGEGKWIWKKTVIPSEDSQPSK